MSLWLIVVGIILAAGSGHQIVRAWTVGECEVNFLFVEAKPGDPPIWFWSIAAANGIIFLCGLWMIAEGAGELSGAK